MKKVILLTIIAILIVGTVFAGTALTKTITLSPEEKTELSKSIDLTKITISPCIKNGAPFCRSMMYENGDVLSRIEVELDICREWKVKQTVFDPEICLNKDTLNTTEIEYRYAIGKWSIKEVLEHIIDDERIRYE